MLVRAVVVAGDGAGADVAVGADLRVAQVGQVRGLATPPEPRLLDLDEVADLGALGSEHRAGAQVGERARRWRRRPGGCPSSDAVVVDARRRGPAPTSLSRRARSGRRSPRPARTRPRSARPGRSRCRARRARADRSRCAPGRAASRPCVHQLGRLARVQRARRPGQLGARVHAQDLVGVVVDVARPPVSPAGDQRARRRRSGSTRPARCPAAACAARAAARPRSRSRSRS